VRAGEVLAECAGPSADPERVAQAFTLGGSAPPPRKLVEAVVREADLAALVN